MDLISNVAPEVYDRVLNMLHAGTLSDIRQLSKYHDTMVARMFYGRLCSVLEPFHFEAASFLSVLGEHNAVLSGSAALLMIHPNDFPPGDLDIFVPGPRSIPLVSSIILLSHHTYSLTPSAPDRSADYQWSGGVDSVHWLKHIATDQRINIIVVKGSDPLVSIAQFDATHAMNFITSTGFGSLYPQLTVSKLSLLNLDPSRYSSRPEWAEKYRTRGYIIESDVSHLPVYGDHRCTTDPSCPNTVRHIRDHHMLYISFLVPNERVQHTLRPSYTSNVAWGLHAACKPKRGREGTMFLGSSGGFACSI